MPFKGLRPLPCSLLLMASLGVATTVGCGVGSTATGTPVNPAALTGTIHGGPNPIIGAKVTIYETQSNGYGGAGKALVSTNTDGNGYFSFDRSSYTCDAGQQAYIVSAGGNTGGNASNPNSVLMAALGDCSTLTQNTVIFINELSTVAAGYALSNFIKVSGTGTSTVVDISAPANNNATPATAGCTGTGDSMVCKAAGLTHAFQNAANLVDAVETGSNPTGTAYSVTPTNANGIVPTLLINTLGNILQSCVNSTGGGVTGGNSDGTPCGTLFANTTPPTTSTTTPTIPTNTLQAVVNLAKFPSMSPAQVSNVFGLQTAQIYYTPNLTAAPADYSMAVIYTGPTGSSHYGYGYYSVMDARDTIYTFSETGNGSGPLVMNQMASNGSAGSTSATITGVECASTSACNAGVDALNHVWLANTYSTNANVYELSTTDNSLVQTITMPSGTAPNAAAVDSLNNVWVTSATTGNNIFKIAAGASSASAVIAGGQVVAEPANPEFITIDGQGSIWNVNWNTSNVTISLIQNTGTLSAPAFGNTVVSSQIASGTGNNSPYSILIDGSGNAWVNNTTKLYKVASGTAALLATYPITGIGNGSNTPVSAAGARYSTLDGDGNIFLPDNNSDKSYLWQFFPSTGNFIYLNPCAGNTTCINSSSPSSGPRPVGVPRNAVTDSTGSVWLTNPVANTTNNAAGNVTQIIGTAAPTWGQMSYGFPGIRPGTETLPRTNALKGTGK